MGTPSRTYPVLHLVPIWYVLDPAVFSSFSLPTWYQRWYQRTTNVGTNVLPTLVLSTNQTNAFLPTHVTTSQGRTQRERDYRFRSTAKEESYWHASALDHMQNEGMGAWRMQKRKGKAGRPRG